MFLGHCSEVALIEFLELVDACLAPDAAVCDRTA